MRIEGVDMPPVIVVDAVYPLCRWLMMPHGGNLTTVQRFYNHIHSKARSVMERAFGHLKACWHYLLLQLATMEENVNSVCTTSVRNVVTMWVGWKMLDMKPVCHRQTRHGQSWMPGSTKGDWLCSVP